ncbi:helix-turn-helix domain-containing protein [Bacillus sp. FSL K6-6540]|uniref:helix-turn-helix domain-containing protein n=1 Tax=Bacillus sp. FSL K6-6540 TaxID=2921512 RepID=UPI0030F94B5E
MTFFQDYMTTKEAAIQWGLSQGTIKNYCASGRVRAIKDGNRWYILKNQPNPAQPNNPHNWRFKDKNSVEK